MVNIAVAGGSGGVGRSIVDTLKADGKHKAIILARKVRECARQSTCRTKIQPLSKKHEQIPDNVELGLPVIAVDYDDVDALQAILEEHRIETVISALALHIIGVGKSQINLIKAAEQASTTKRFVTSTWAVRPSTEQVPLRIPSLGIPSLTRAPLGIWPSCPTASSISIHTPSSRRPDSNGRLSTWVGSSNTTRCHT